MFKPQQPLPIADSRLSKHAIPGFTLKACDGYYQIRKIGLTAERVKKDPAFRRTRLHAQEFASIVKLTKQLAGHLLSGTGIKNAMPGLNSIFLQALRADSVNRPGNRSLVKGNWQALIGFDINPLAAWEDIVKPSFKCEYKEDFQQIRIYIPPLIPARHINGPMGITHCRIKMALISIDAQHTVTFIPWRQTTIIPLKHIQVPGTEWKIDIMNGPDRLHLVVGWVQWYEPGDKSKSLRRSSLAGPLIIQNAYKLASP